MLSTLLTLLNTAALAHADPSTATGLAARDSAEASPGFAALMQQQTDLRLADQRLSEQRRAEQRRPGQRATEAGPSGMPAQPPATPREPVARPAEASRLDRQRNHRPAAAEPTARTESQADGPAPAAEADAPGTPTAAAAKDPADAHDRAATAPGSAGRRRSDDAENRSAAAAGSGGLARTRGATRPAQRLAEAADAALAAPPLAGTPTGDASTAAPAAPDDRSAAGTSMAADAARETSALQPWLQAQAMVTGWQPVAGLETPVPTPATAPDAESGTDALAAWTDRPRRAPNTASATTTRLDRLAPSAGDSAAAQRAPLSTEATMADATALGRSDGSALPPAPAVHRLPAATDGAPAPGRPAAAAERSREPVDAGATASPPRTTAALGVQAALALTGAARPTPTEAASNDAADASAPEKALPDGGSEAPNRTSSGDVTAAAAALAVQAIAVAPPAAAATVADAGAPAQARVAGTPSATAITPAGIASAQTLRTGGNGAPGVGAEGPRSSDPAGPPRSGPAGNAPADRPDAATRPPGAPDLLAGSIPPGDAQRREPAADGARPAAEGTPNARGVVDGRPVEATGMSAPAPAGARPDSPTLGTQTDLLRVAEAGPANASAQSPLTSAVPASGATAAAPPGAAAGPVHEARIPVPLDSPAFAPALGAQISLFARDGVQTARLELNPAEMGPISVQIALDGSAARVDFQADLAGTREVIEASLPALAGALQDAGLTLTGGGVFQQTPGRQGQGDAASSQRDTGRDLASGTAGPAPETLVRARRGLVDLVA